MDEVDIEEARLDFLKAQQQRRLTELIEVSKEIGAKPKHKQVSPRFIGVDVHDE